MISEFSTSHKEKAVDHGFSGMPEYQVWERFCSGDDMAFTYVYRKYVQHLFNFGYQVSKDRELTRDIIQDIFIKLRSAGKKQKIRSVKSYLFKCFYNEWVRKARLNATNTTLENERLAVTVSCEDTLIRDQQDRDKLYYLDKALRQLTFKQRKAITLFYYEGLSYAETAEAMNLKNAKSARKIIYRAVERLKPDSAVMKVLFSFLL